MWTSQLQPVFNLMRWSSSMQPINFTIAALIPCGRESNQFGDPVQILNWFLARKWGCLLVWPEARLGSLIKPVSTVYFMLGTLRTDLWSQGKCTTVLVKMSFICMRMKNRFHIKGWTLERPIGRLVVLQETWASTELIGWLAYVCSCLIEVNTVLNVIVWVS